MRTVVGGGRDTHDGHENSPILVFFSNLLVAERLFQDALRLARTPGNEQIPIFLEAKHIHGTLEQTLSKSGYEIVADGSMLVIIDGLAR